MPTNYCPYCGRFMMMKEFEHACDRVNVLRGVKEWCNRCGGKLEPMTDDMDEALCHRCRSRLDPFEGDND